MCSNLWKEHFFSTHDTLWSLDVRGPQTVPTLVAALDAQLEAIGHGDQRFDVYARLPHVLDALNHLLTRSRDQRSDRELNLMRKSTKECLVAFKQAPKHLVSMGRFRDIQRTVSHFADEYQLG